MCVCKNKQECDTENLQEGLTVVQESYIDDIFVAFLIPMVFLSSRKCF